MKTIVVIIAYALVIIISSVVTKQPLILSALSVLLVGETNIERIINKILSNKYLKTGLFLASLVCNLILLLLLCYGGSENIPEPIAYVEVPNVMEKTLDEAKEILTSENLGFSGNAGSDAKVCSQNPRAGIQVAPNTIVDLEFDSDDLVSDNIFPGDIITFGTYDQDPRNDGLTGVTEDDIEWVVLDKKDDQILIISRMGLEALPYNATKEETVWEGSSIRQWLNGIFYMNAFTESQRSQIVATDLTQHTHSGMPHVDQGDDTTDFIFLLSLAEYKEYLYDNGNISADYRRGRPTELVLSQNKDMESLSWWWLRTVADKNKYACSVGGYGEVDQGTRPVNKTTGLIRPAMWITIK